MKLSKIKICNYRSFGSEVTINLNDLTSFIGNNSSGKTAALTALQKLFGNTSGERILSRSDFHVEKGEEIEKIESKELYIEAVFKFPGLKAEEDKDRAIPMVFNKLTIDDQGGEPYLRIRLEAIWNKGTTLEGTIDSRICYITQSEKDSEILEGNKHLAKQQDINRISLIYVPAARNPASQLKNASNSILYRVLSNINWSSQVKENIAIKINEIEKEFDKENGVKIIKNAIKEEWLNYHNDSRYTNADFRFNSSDLEGISKKVDVEFAPTFTGRPYNVDDLGDGLKSLFYISLVNSLLSIEEKITEENADEYLENKSFRLIPPICTILALEEPENHISPQLLGKIILNIKKIAGNKNCQAIISSHSASIISRIEPEDIRYFRINGNDLSSSVRALELPPKDAQGDEIFKYVKNAVKAYPELYFSSLVILGEGDSEEILLPKIIEVDGDNIDSNCISIVPLGGRHVNHFWKLLNQLNIPFITLLDLDRERYLGGWGRIKYVCEQLIINGIDCSKLLSSKDINLLGNFEKMHEWDVTEVEEMNKWIKYLESYNIYFSSPLDIDFLMLKHFKDYYIDIIKGNEGPRIDGIGKIKDVTDKSIKEFMDRVKEDIKHALKEKSTAGTTFSDQEKELMIWYNYFFLTRGKPTTHRIALLGISDETLKSDMPQVFNSLKSKISFLLNKSYMAVNEEGVHDEIN